MSWWIHLENDNGDDVEVETHSEGGAYVVGGTNTACINVTYNYGRHFHFPELDGLTGEASLPVLTSAARELGTDVDDDYWAPTPGNAGHTCQLLAEWARQHPAAVWCVS